MIINSDDILLPNALEEVARYYEPGIDIYRGNVIIRNKDTGFTGRDIPSNEISANAFFCEVDHQGTFVTVPLHRPLGRIRCEVPLYDGS